MKKKRNIKVIYILASIIILMIVAIIVGTHISKTKNNVINNMKKEEIIHINVLPTAKKFYFKDGYINFFQNEYSVYGNENDKNRFAINKQQSYWLSKRDYGMLRLNENPKISYYNRVYDSYLKIFDNIKYSRSFNNTIIISKKELQKKYLNL